MKTDDLVQILAKANLPKTPLPLWGALTAFFVGCTLLTFLLIGFRAELQDGIYPLGFLIRTGLLLSFALTTSFIVYQSSLPKIFVMPKIVLTALAILMTALVVHEWMTVAVRDILNPHYLINMMSCFFYVSLYGGIGAVILARALKNYAPLDAKNAAGFVGLAAASIGAIGYSFHCPVDSPSCVLFSYGLPTLLIWALSRKYLSRSLAW